MRALHAGLVAACGLFVAASAQAAPARHTASPLPPPKVLNIVRVKVKPRMAGSYAALEAQIVRAYERAKARIHWICLQSDRDATDVLYVNLADSQASWNATTAAYQTLTRQHPEVLDLQSRLARMTVSSTSVLTLRRDDVDRAAPGVDFRTMRTLRLTTVDVTPGREGAFLDAVRTAPASDGAWMIYEAADSSTYAMITLSKVKLTRKDGRTLPRSLRRSKGVLAKVDSRVYTVRPAMSHPPPGAPVVTTH